MIVYSLLNFEAGGQNVPDSSRIHRIETEDGNIFTGVIIAEDSLTLTLLTKSLGELKINQADIKMRTEFNDAKSVGNSYWLPNPQSSRYFWAPDGYGLRKREIYYQNIWVLYNQVSVAITNNFSLGAGMLPLFLFSGITPVWIVPKFSFTIKENKINVGTGAFLGLLIGKKVTAYGLFYETTTFGSRDKNVSIGLAEGFMAEHRLKFPLINLSAMVRTGPRSYFVTENYAITTGGQTILLLSAGGRRIIRNIGLDYSLWVPLGAGMNRFIALPFLGITIPFGKTPVKY